MKKILILTDFSDNSTHAALAGLELAARLKVDIVLYHVYPLLPITPMLADTVTSRTADAILQDTTERLLLLKQLLCEAREGANASFKPDIEMMSDTGGLGANLKALLQKEAFEALVMGARQGSALNHFLDGSDTRSVIESAGRPILIIPPKATCHWRKIILATGFRSEDFHALDCLLDWKARAGFELNIAHVDEVGDIDADSVIKEISFREKLNKVNEKQQLVYYDVRGRNVGARLIRLCKQAHADVLALVHYRSDLLARITGKSKTLQALHEQKLPLLVFPPDMLPG